MFLLHFLCFRIPLPQMLLAMSKLSIVALFAVANGVVAMDIIAVTYY